MFSLLIQSFREMPFALKIAFVVLLFLGVGTTIFAFMTCGPKAFLLGNGALFAAIAGMCG